MSAAEAVDLAVRVRPRFVVPHHYDMFTFNTVPVEAFASEARRLPAGVAAADPPLRGALGGRAVSVTLGIDIGTSGTKTLAIDETGTILASATAEYPCDHPRPGLVRAAPGTLVGCHRPDGAASPGLGQVPPGGRGRASG